MKKMKTEILLLAAAIISAIFSGCSKEDPVVTQIKFEQPTISVIIGNNQQLTVSHTPSDLPAPSYQWESSDISVATVNNQGYLTALSVGSTTIKATTTSGLQASCNITVTPIEALSIKLSKNELTLFIEQEETLTYTITPDNTTNKVVVWSSENSNIATVDNNGKVTAVGVGQTKIKVATSNSISDACEITVNPVNVTGITLDKTALTLERLENITLIANISPANATNKKINWSSDNNAVATVSSSGEISALAIGIANITAKTEDGSFEAKCAVTVKEISVKGIALDNSDIKMAIGESKRLIASVTPNNSANQSIQWSSSNSNIATVDNNGNVYVLSQGNVYITATTDDGGHQASCLVRALPIDQLVKVLAQGYTFSTLSNPSRAIFKLNSKITNPTSISITLNSVMLIDENRSLLQTSYGGAVIANNTYHYNLFDAITFYGNSFGTAEFNRISQYKVIYQFRCNGIDYSVETFFKGNIWGNLNK